MKTKTSFRELYAFPGFRARSRFKCGVFQDQKARVVELVRRQKKRCARNADSRLEAITTTVSIVSGIWTPVATAFLSSSSIGVWIAGGARP